MVPFVKRFRRAVVLILDGVGIGALPDAAAYGDEDADSLGNTIAARGRLALPHLASLGLGRLKTLPGYEATPVTGGYGRVAMKAAGKDSTSGHWEMAGVVLDEPFPVFPDGFPAAAVRKMEEETGRRFIGNRAASGTAIIAELGEEHLRTGAIILYTSADSVCQLAAHVAVVAPEDLDAVAQTVRGVMKGPWGVARVITRPFAGEPGSFRRINSRRRDFSLPPPAPTLWENLTNAGYDVRGVGKVDDIFCRRGISRCTHAPDNDAAFRALLDEMREDFDGVVLANLNDTDTVYGHRNDVQGYARALELFDASLPQALSALRESDLFIILSDHGNDPTTPSTDHSREYIPLLVTYRSLRGEVPLGDRATLADAGQTLAENFNLGPLAAGQSFLYDI